jgi:outer membrane scaffolding protein for murein synthesis (MipA/OmpV family)
MRTFFAVPKLQKLRYLIGLPLSGFASSALAMVDVATPSLDLTSDGGSKAETSAPEDPEQAAPRPELAETMGANATDTAESRYPRDSLTIGVGVITLPSYPGSSSNSLSPAGLIRGSVNGFDFSSRGANLSVDLIRERRGTKVNVSFGPVANLRTDRSGSVKDAQIIELGGWAGIGKTGVFTSPYDRLSAGVRVVRDVLGKHRSTIITPSIDYATPLSRTTFVGISASASFVGKRFGRTYYDVSPQGSAASGLPVYSAAGRKSGMTHYSLGLIGVKSLSGDLRKGWTLLAGTQFSRVQGRYARSPIVRQRGQWVGGLGVAYSF